MLPRSESLYAICLAAVWCWVGTLKISVGGWLLVPALLEIALGVAFLFPAWRRRAGLASIGLAAVFLLVTLYRWHFLGAVGGCGCFGDWEPTLKAHLLLLAGIGLVSTLAVSEFRPTREVT